MSSSTFWLLDAGPKVATIFVLRNIRILIPVFSAYLLARCSRISTAGSVLPSRNSKKAPPAVEI
jgi:hypothetical protein